MNLTAYQLKRTMACKASTADRWLPHINRVVDRYEISNLERLCMYLAEIGHESMSLRYKEEIASGEAYEGRISLGNKFPGDGVAFKGHGLIQVTGRTNHEAYASYLGMSLKDTLEYIVTDEGAADSSGWYWIGMPRATPLPPLRNWNLNLIADRDTDEAFYEVSVNINGRSHNTGHVQGLGEVRLPNGWDDRMQRWDRAWQVLEEA